MFCMIEEGISLSPTKHHTLHACRSSLQRENEAALQQYVAVDSASGALSDEVLAVSPPLLDTHLCSHMAEPRQISRVLAAGFIHSC